jgi:hypothetical protein
VDKWVIANLYYTTIIHSLSSAAPCGVLVSFLCRATDYIADHLGRRPQRPRSSLFHSLSSVRLSAKNDDAMFNTMTLGPQNPPTSSPAPPLPVAVPLPCARTTYSVRGSADVWSVDSRVVSYAGPCLRCVESEPLGRVPLISPNPSCLASVRRPPKCENRSSFGKVLVKFCLTTAGKPSSNLPVPAREFVYRCLWVPFGTFWYPGRPAEEFGRKPPGALPLLDSLVRWVGAACRAVRPSPIRTRAVPAGNSRKHPSIPSLRLSASFFVGICGMVALAPKFHDRLCSRDVAGVRSQSSTISGSNHANQRN